MSIVRDLGGSPSWLDSYLMWRKLSRMGEGVQAFFEMIDYHFPEPFWQFLKKAGREQCPFCGGWGQVQQESIGTMYCLCEVLKWASAAQTAAETYGSFVTVSELSDLVIDRGSPAQRDRLMAAKDVVEDWMIWPARWLVLSGTVGVGKTTMLGAIKGEFPIAMYVTAHDFEQQLYKRLDDVSLNEYLDALSTAPILMFDDWGAEYGKSYVHAKALAVIDRRDHSWRDLITVVATNLSPENFKDYNQRMGSRLLDPEKVILLPIVVPDHRVPRVGN